MLFRLTIAVALAAACLPKTLHSQPPQFPKLPLPRLDKDSNDDAPREASERIRGLLDRIGTEAPSPEELADAIKQRLASSGAAERIEALMVANEQGEQRPEILERLKTIIEQSEQPLERVLAATASLKANLDEQSLAQIIDQLAEGIGSDDPMIANQSAVGLALGGKASEEALTEALDDSDPVTRSLAAEALGTVRSDETVTKLVTLLKDTDTNVRAAAAKSLGKVESNQDKAVTALLESLTSDSEVAPRAFSAASLVKLDGSSPRVQNALVKAINNDDEATGLAVIRAVANSDAPQQDRAVILGDALIVATPVYAAEITGHLVDLETAGMEALRRALEPMNSRYWAVVGLAEFNTDREAIGDALASLIATSTPDVNTEILIALGRLKPSSDLAKQAVIGQMSSEYPGVRYAATLAAARMNLDGQAVQTNLTANRASDDKVLALVSSFALAKLNPKDPKTAVDAIQALHRAVQSGDERLKPLALQALKELPDNLPSSPKATVMLFRKLLPILIIASLCGCGGALSTEFTVPKSAIQTGLDAWMPVDLTQYAERELPATVMLQSAEILMSDGTDRIGFRLNLDVALQKVDAVEMVQKIQKQASNRLPKGPRGGIPAPPFAPKPSTSDEGVGEANQTFAAKKIDGHVIARVGVRYDSEKAAFYCQNAEAETIEIGDLPTDLAPPIKQLCENALNKYFDENPVYTLSGDDQTTNLAKAHLKNVTVRDGNLLVEIGI